MRRNHAYTNRRGTQRSRPAPAFLLAFILASSLLLLAGCGPANTPSNPSNIAQPTLPPPSQQQIQAIHMLDDLHGWITTQQAVLRTSNGGHTWQDVTPRNAISRAKVTQHIVACYLNASTAWAAIAQQNATTTLIYHTTNGGQSWQSASIETRDIGVVQIDFINAQDGWLLSNAGVAAGSEAVDIWRTTDGGQSWKRVASAGPNSANQPNALPFGGNKSGLSFLSATVGWIAGSEPTNNRAWLYKTNDGGASWQQQSLPLPARITSAQLNILPPTFFNAHDGVLPVNVYTPTAPGIYIYVTHDGGATWQSGAPLPASAFATSFADAAHGWAADQNTLYTTSDGGQHWTKLTPGGDFNSVIQLDFISPTAGWALRLAASATTHILKTSDGGHSWTQVY